MTEEASDVIKLAQLWSALEEMRRKLNNEIIPVAAYLGLGIEGPELMIALEDLAAKIEQHFEQFKLIPERRR